MIEQILFSNYLLMFLRKRYINIFVFFPIFFDSFAETTECKKSI